MTVEYYNQHATEFYSSTVNVDMENIYQHFIPHLKHGDLIVDAGCGSGRDALYFKSLGFNVEAFDASIALAKKAEKLINQPVSVTTFEHFTLPSLANGIWCCASLLHVSKDKLLASLSNLDNQLVSGGVMYVSFKYGDTERVNNGRTFTDVNESILTHLINQLPHLHIHELWITGDNRPNREDEKWLNAILLKS
ncbi:class I SAM-dependent methyltransferase [Thalassotalea piscium]